MPESRREFLKQVGALGCLTACQAATPCNGAEPRDAESDGVGVLVDTTRCVGCRRCEKACNTINDDLPRKDAASFDDATVLAQPRRMDSTTYTVVNRYRNPSDPAHPVHVKFQCMHCRDAACVSACIVGALKRDATGAIQYNAWKCIGCRYCMVACPFQVPGYEYGNALTPQVRKCTFCLERRIQQGMPPACVQACPMETMSFGKRSHLLASARRRIAERPGRYVRHIYGEHEVGGTSWLYLASLPFGQIGFPKLGNHPTPGYTEPIQHAIFKWFLPPLAVYTVLGAIWWRLARRRREEESESEPA